MVAGNARAAFAAAPQQAPQPDNLDQLQLDNLALRLLCLFSRLPRYRPWYSRNKASLKPALPT